MFAPYELVDVLSLLTVLCDVHITCIHDSQERVIIYDDCYRTCCTSYVTSTMLQLLHRVLTYYTERTNVLYWYTDVLTYCTALCTVVLCGKFWCTLGRFQTPVEAKNLRKSICAKSHTYEVQSECSIPIVLCWIIVLCDSEFTDSYITLSTARL